MTRIYTERDADPGALDGLSVAILGYGNQGRPWALNLRDSSVPVLCFYEHREGPNAERLGETEVDDALCAIRTFVASCRIDLHRAFVELEGSALFATRLGLVAQAEVIE